MKRPKKGQVCYYFDRLMMKPIKVEFVGVSKSDGWFRFKFLEASTACSEYTSAPPSSWGDNFCDSYQNCILAAVKLLIDRYDKEQISHCF